MFSIMALLIVLTLSILVTRIAAVALTHTGLTRETARFQARSAFTGVGFTTSESEKLVNHPVRRKILQMLMLVGNAGIITAVSSLILSFIDGGNTLGLAWKVVLIVAGAVLLLSLASSKWVDRHLSNLISRTLNRYTSLDVKDYAGMLRLAGEYQVTEMQVNPDGWLAGRRLAQSQLTDEGIIVLGVTRKDGTYIGAPKGDTVVRPHDTVILYGRSAAFSKLEKRKPGAEGDRDHARGVAEQEEIQEQEKIKDESAGGREEESTS